MQAHIHVLLKEEGVGWALEALFVDATNRLFMKRVGPLSLSLPESVSFKVFQI